MKDLHCHIIPGIDDGAKRIEDTLKMAQMAQDDGIEEIVATPHFMEGRFEVPYLEVKEKVKKLNDIILENGLKTKILPGQEIFLNKNTLEYFEKGLIGGLNDSRFFLFELNPIKFDKRIPDILYELGLHGVHPVIAHPERYKYIIEDTTRLNRLIEEGCSFQLNIGSLEGTFGKEVKRCAEKLLDLGIYDFIGTDAHGTGRRNPVLRKRIMEQKKKYIERLLLLSGNNEDLINEEFEERKIKKIEKKKTFGFLSFGR